MRVCMLAVRRARGRARLEADPTKRLKNKCHEEGRTWVFPPELDYLDTDPGITVEQMLQSRSEVPLRVAVLRSRAERNSRLQERLKALRVGLPTC